MSEPRFDAPTPHHVDRAEEQTQPSWAVWSPATRAYEDTPAIPRQVVGPGRLVLSRGPEVGASFPVAMPRTTIGRHYDCDIVLDDVTISRHHADIHRYPDRYVISDASSLNGVYVNRRPVQRAELHDGDEIWIGKARFTFHAEVAPDEGLAGNP